MTLLASVFATLAIGVGEPPRSDAWVPVRRHRHHRHRRPRPRRPAPLRSALASWYDDSGTTASGTHAPYGFAALIFGSAWGHRVEFHYAGHTVVGQLDDHGPYVGGRTFDLSARLRAALGCPDLCYLRWRELR